MTTLTTTADTDVTQMPMRFSFPHLIVQHQPEQVRTMLAAAAAQQGPADTFGWDTVFAIKATDANTAMAKPGVSPASFTQNENATWFGTGNFGAWQIALGGGAENLHMSIPVTSGSMTYQGIAYPMTNAVAMIEVNLMKVPQPASNNGTPTNLVTDPSVVSVTGLTFGANPPPNSIKFLMMGLLSDWLNANLSQFTHVFSTVNLGETADKAQFQWMKPTDVSYAYVDGATLDASYFAVLTMTEHRSAAGLPQELSPNVVPTGQRAGFLISSERYLEKLLMPGLPSLFQNATVGNFTPDQAAVQIRNNAQLSMTAVTVGAGTYTPVIDANNFSCSIVGTEIVMDIKKAHVAFSPGIDIYLDYTYYGKLVLQLNSKGEQILTVESSRTAVTSHYVDVATWVTITEVIAGVVAGVISGFVGAGTKAIFQVVAYRVIATILALLVLGVLSQIGTIMIAVAEGDKDNIPPINLAIVNATNPTTWPGGSGFTLTSAGLNGLLQLGGNPGFA